MTGPRVVRIDDGPKPMRRPVTEGATGCRRTDSGWLAIINGRLVGGPFRGSRGFLQASRTAGTTDVIR